MWQSPQSRDVCHSVSLQSLHFIVSCRWFVRRIAGDSAYLFMSSPCHHLSLVRILGMAAWCARGLACCFSSAVPVVVPRASSRVGPCGNGRRNRAEVHTGEQVHDVAISESSESAPSPPRSRPHGLPCGLSLICPRFVLKYLMRRHRQGALLSLDSANVRMEGTLLPRHSASVGHNSATRWQWCARRSLKDIFRPFPPPAASLVFSFQLSFQFGTNSAVSQSTDVPILGK